MRILADFHHSDLYESLQLTFGDRFGAEVYAPYGMGWFEQGYWAFEKPVHGDAVARQYLVGVWPDPVDEGTHVRQNDGTHPGRDLLGLSIEQALDQTFDIVICSLPEWPEHFDGFRRLADRTGAKLFAQVGNVGAVNRIDWSRVDAGLISSTTPGVHIPVPHVIYRQEFRLDDFRPEWPPQEPNSVASFIQCFPENKGFYDEFLGYARAYPEFDWKVYGAYGTHPPDEFAQGNLPSTPAVAVAMRRTRMAWHAKWWSDGYGHVVHNLFATGTPVIGYADYYADKLAGPLWVDGQTCLDLSRHSKDEVVAFMRRLRDDDDFHREISENAAARFRECVNFDEDAERIRDLMDAVLT